MLGLLTLIRQEAIAKHIMKVLSLTNGKVHGKGGAADKLGVNPSTLRNRMNKLGIEYKRGGNTGATEDL